MERTLIVKPTNDCNLDCKYCYNKSKKSSNKMSLEDVEKICKNLEPGVTYHWFWHGGEPLLMGLDWYKQANAILKKHGVMDITYQTNGTLLNDLWEQYFLEENIRIGVSYDGYCNDDNRKFGNNILNIIKKYSDIISVNITFTPETIKFYKETLDLIKDEDFQLNILFNDSLTKEDYEYMADKMIEIFEYCVENKIPVYHTYIKFVENSMCENVICFRRWFGIDWNGDVYPCGRLWSKEYCLGNIFKEKIKDISSSEKMKKFIDSFYPFRKKCNNCEVKQYCNYGCFNTRLMNENICYYYKKMYKYFHEE